MADIQRRSAATRETEEHGSATPGTPARGSTCASCFILGAITAVEVALYYVREDDGRLVPAACCSCLMGSKFAIVVLWYMHLKFDDRRLRAVLHHGARRRGASRSTWSS